MASTTVNTPVKPDNTRWSSADEATLVATLKECRKEGMQADSGWKPTAWTKCVEALKDSESASGGAGKGVAAIKSRWQRVRDCFIACTLLF